MDTTDRPVLNPAFTISVDGSDLPPAARGDVAAIAVEDSLDSASTFSIEVNNWDSAQQTVSWSDDNLFDPGRSVEIKLGYTEQVASVIKGEITGLELAFPPDIRSRLIVRGYDRLHRVRRGRRTKSYLQVKDSDVAQQLASALGLTGDVEDSGEVHPYLLQLNQTDVDFLLTRARAIGFELEVDDRKLVFRKIKNDRGKTQTLSFTKGLQRFDGYISTSQQVTKVTVHGWDPKAKQALVGHAQPSDVSGTMNGSQVGPAKAHDLFGDKPLAVIEHPVSTQNEADLLAKGVLNEIALEYVVADATVTGDPDLAAGSVVELDGIGTRFSGLYYVSRVRHVFDGSYLTHLRLRRNAS